MPSLTSSSAALGGGRGEDPEDGTSKETQKGALWVPEPQETTPQEEPSAAQRAKEGKEVESPWVLPRRACSSPNAARSARRSNMAGWGAGCTAKARDRWAYLGSRAGDSGVQCCPGHGAEDCACLRPRAAPPWDPEGLDILRWEKEQQTKA